MARTDASRRRWLRAAAAAMAASAWPLAQALDEDAPVIEEIDVGASRIELQFAPGFDAALRERARTWVRRCADVVIGYFGRFPVRHCELLLVPTAGDGVGGGMSFGEPSVLVRVRVGTATSAAQFLDDWVLVHEMVHLAIPDLPRAQRWWHEGVATYVEGIARARAGLVDEVSLWGGFERGMPQGQPREGDAGLDHTHTWGRTYWGGAMFCLLADVQMRRRSAQRAGLQQALQGVLAAGGNYSQRWPFERVLSTADAAVGQHTLGELYALTRDCPAAIDLDALWQDLGVATAADGAVSLRADAPLAALRRSIVA